MRNFISKLANTPECIVIPENNAVLYSIPSLTLESHGKDTQKICCFFTSPQTEIIKNIDCIKYKKSVNFIISSKSVEFYIQISLVKQILLFLKIRATGSVVLKFEFEEDIYERIVIFPDEILNTNESFIDDLITKAMIFYYGEDFNKSDFFEINKIVKNTPKRKQEFMLQFNLDTHSQKKQKIDLTIISDIVFFAKNYNEYRQFIELPNHITRIIEEQLTHYKNQTLLYNRILNILLNFTKSLKIEVK